MVSTPSQELLLIAACAMWPPSDMRSELVRRHAAAQLSEDKFLRLVMRHRVAGLVHDALSRTDTAISPDIAARVRQQAIASVQQSVLQGDETLKLHRLFSDAGIPVLFMKGGPLALLCYGNLGLRHSRDIDLLVSSGSLVAATALLERSGYRRQTPLPSFGCPQLRMWLRRTKELEYIHEQRRLRVELHVRPFDNPELLPGLPSGGPARLVPFGNSGVAPTFNEDDHFTYLCAHGALHSWFRLIWLADIGALLARQPAGGAMRLYRAAEARGVAPAAAQAFVLCRQLLGSTLPDDLLQTLTADRTVRWLVSIATKAIVADRPPTERRFGTTWNSIARILVNRGWRYRMTECKLYLTSPADILAMPLPAGLGFLYPALRLPLWAMRRTIWRKHPS
jgi:hypothetical protein